MACKQCRSLPMLLFMVVNSTIGGNNFFGSSGNIVSHIIFHKRYYLLSFRPKTWSRFLNLTMLKKLLHRSKFSSIWNNGIYSVRKKCTVFRRLRMFLWSYFLSRCLHPWLMTMQAWSQIFFLPFTFFQIFHPKGENVYIMIVPFKMTVNRKRPSYFFKVVHWLSKI